MKVNFYVTPTLVDSYLWYLKFGCDPAKKQEIFDKINKVKIEYPEAAKKGVAFEDCVNLVLSGQNIYKKDGFTFEPALVDKIAYKLQNNIGTQVWIERIVPFEGGQVRIGGFVDYDYPSMQIDLKTTGNYKLGKFESYSQHRAYGLIKPEKKEFKYLVTDFDNYYIEPYKNTENRQQEFIHNVGEFYNFCKENEHLIIDKKIWGL